MKVVYVFMFDGPKRAGTKLFDWLIESDASPRSFSGVSKSCQTFHLVSYCIITKDYLIKAIFCSIDAITALSHGSQFLSHCTTIPTHDNGYLMQTRLKHTATPVLTSKG